jgi:hypothetical protein
MEIRNLGWKIESAKELKWVNAEKTKMDCVVKFEHFDEEIVFTIDPNDMYKHSLDLWEKANAGEYGDIADYITTPKSEFEQLMENYKNQFGGEFSLDKI